MQAITRNPLAEPGLLGVNAGAAFAVVFAIYLFDIGTLLGLRVVRLRRGGDRLGDGVRARLDWAAAGRPRSGWRWPGRRSSALLGAFTSAVLLLDQQALDQYRFWAVGSLAGRDESTLLDVLPFIAVGLVLSIGLARPLNALGLGEDTARALGTRSAGRGSMTAVAVTLLCGAATAACGPIAFVGSRRAARGAVDLRARPALADALLGRARSGRAAHLRHRRPRRRPSLRGPGRHHDRGDRWPGVRDPRAARADGAAVTATVDDPGDDRAAEARRSPGACCGSRRWSVRLDTRAVGVSLVLSALIVVVGCWSISVGDFPIPIRDVDRHPARRRQRGRRVHRRDAAPAARAHRHPGRCRLRRVGRDLPVARAQPARLAGRHRLQLRRRARRGVHDRRRRRWQRPGLGRRPARRPADRGAGRTCARGSAACRAIAWSWSGSASASPSPPSPTT